MRRPATAPCAATHPADPWTADPAEPPIPSILSHAPTRSHLFRHLLHQLQLGPLGQLLLLLDLLAIVRGHASQTNWSFDDPFLAPPPSTAAFLQSSSPSKPKSRIRIRPDTSDGLRTPASSRLRPHSRSHVFRSIVAPPHANALQPTHTNPILQQNDHLPSIRTPSQPPWLAHLVELYKPPQVDIDHGWFVPVPLPPHSHSYQFLAKQLSSNPNISTTINPGVDALKRVGELACQQLSELESVRDWWSQHSSHLWPQCSRLQKCQSFNDLLSLWPSLHFPTPSLSQLYKISNHLSKSRTRLRLTELPSPEALSNQQAVHSQATLRGLFEIYIGPPSPNDLESIKKLSHQPRSIPPQTDISNSFSAQALTHPQAHSRSPILRHDVTAPYTSPFTLHALPESDDDRKMDLSSENPNSENAKPRESRSHKLRQFFGHEIDSILPPTTTRQEPYSRDHTATSYLDQPPTSYFSTYTTISNISVSLASAPVRRKSTTSPVEFDRPRKRSSIATIDISLATLTTSSHNAEIEQQPSTSQPSETHTRLTVVGTSPSSTPTFLGASLPHSPKGHLHATKLGRPGDYYHTGDMTSGGDSITEELEENSTTWRLEQSVRDNDAIKLKRMTKLEKLLGEPLDSTTTTGCYAGLGVQIVREVVEDVEFRDAITWNNDTTSLRRHPHPCAPASIGHRKSHSRASSASHPSSFSDISRERFPHSTSTCSVHQTSSRPSTAQSEILNGGPSSFSNKFTGKRRLGKLHRFFDEVVTHHTHHHHHKSASSDITTNSKTKSSSVVPHSRHSDSNDLDHKNNRSSTSRSEHRHVKKQSSFFKFSSSSPSSTSSSTTVNNILWTTDKDIASRAPSCDETSYAHSFAPPRLFHHPSNTLSQYSHRSARKLEKLLGEQIPRHTQCFGKIPDRQMFWNTNKNQHRYHQQQQHHHGQVEDKEEEVKVEDLNGEDLIDTGLDASDDLLSLHASDKLSDVDRVTQFFNTSNNTNSNSNTIKSIHV